jgi:hypothetical protein
MDINRFRQLLESQLGDVKPLVSENKIVKKVLSEKKVSMVMYDFEDSKNLEIYKKQWSDLLKHYNVTPTKVANIGNSGISGEEIKIKEDGRDFYVQFGVDNDSKTCRPFLANNNRIFAGFWQFINGQFSYDESHYEGKRHKLPTDIKDCQSWLTDNIIKRGSKNHCVKWMKHTLLKNNGESYDYITQDPNGCRSDANKCDGNFGPKTEQAVKDFQTYNQIKSDGIVGPQTFNYMFWGSVSGGKK